MYPYEFEYFWKLKQQERYLNNKKAYSQNYLYPKGVILPAINPYRVPELALPVAQQTLAAAKLEIDGKN